jgi:hypothetical protein
MRILVGSYPGTVEKLDDNFESLYGHEGIRESCVTYHV